MIVKPQKKESRLLTISKINSLNEVNDSIVRDRAKRAACGRSQEYIAIFEGAEAAFLSFEDWSDKSIGFIYEIFVLPVYRKQGIGTKLLLYAESLAMSLGCSVIELKPDAFDRSVSSELLVSWYRKNGYDFMTGDTEKMEKSFHKTGQYFTCIDLNELQKMTNVLNKLIELAKVLKGNPILNVGMGLISVGLLTLGGGLFGDVNVVTEEWAISLGGASPSVILQVISIFVIVFGCCLVGFSVWTTRPSRQPQEFIQASATPSGGGLDEIAANDASISSPYIPKVRSSSSEREVQEFLWESFQAIKEYFVSASQAVMQNSPTVKLEIDTFVDDSFTGRVYLKGQPLEAFTIYQDASSQGIVYIKEYNYPRVAEEYDGMACVDDLGEELAFDATIKPARFLESWSGGSSGDAKDIAEYFWQDFISCVEAH